MPTVPVASKPDALMKSSDRVDRVDQDEYTARGKDLGQASLSIKNVPASLLFTVRQTRKGGKEGRGVVVVEGTNKRVGEIVKRAGYQYSISHRWGSASGASAARQSHLTHLLTSA